jgi:hypothetical protein
MTYFIFNRDTLQLEGAFNKPTDDHTEDRFIVLEMTDSQTPFRKTLDRLKVTHLEVKLMYRNAGNIHGPISDYRDSIISYLYYLLASGKALTKHTVTLFNQGTEPLQAGTGRHRPRSACQQYGSTGQSGDGPKGQQSRHHICSRGLDVGAGRQSERTFHRASVA